MTEDLEFKKSDFDYAGQDLDRLVLRAEVPSLLCDLARALPMPVCPPEHTLREAMTYCKACDESRDELQQMVGDGDLNAIAVVVGVYLRRLYKLHEGISARVWELGGEYKPVKVLCDELEQTFAEVLSDEDRGIPTDDEAVRMVKEMIAPVAMGENLSDEEYERRRIK